jgi:hypothetical protein
MSAMKMSSGVLGVGKGDASAKCPEGCSAFVIGVVGIPFLWVLAEMLTC